MIGMNWKKSLMVAGVSLAVAAVVPAMTQAHTPYTGVIPPSIAMMATPVAAPTMLTTHHTKKVASHHRVLKKSTKLAKHKVSKKHKKLGAKKRAV